MDQTKVFTASRLMSSSSTDGRDELDEKFDRCLSTLQTLISGLSDKEAHDTLSKAVCKDKIHEEVCIGLLILILTDPQEALKRYRDLTLINRDGLAVVLAYLNQIVVEKYLRLNDVPKTQLLWLTREMIRTNVTNVDNLCLNLLRHAAGGDISQRNIALIEVLLDIFEENRLWLDKFPFLTATIVYTFLRLIEDHSAQHLINLRQKEVIFIVNMIREKINDCLVIGRDLVRLLQNVARIPEFDCLWKDILCNPKSLNTNFTGIVQLLHTRTSRRFLQSRLTPDMERKLVFLTSQVRFGNHKRYQEWFQRQYLATPESQTLRCDLIRFIVGVIHPTNELLCSDIIPRWAVIGWLFTTCTLPVAASNVKLALFYDWMFFDAEKDNIMNIEPAILVMHNSMRSHPAVTATLLDFLCRIASNFYPPMEEKVRSGIFSSLKQILEKRVLPSLYPLFDSPKLDRELRCQIREIFKEFCLTSQVETGKIEDAHKELSSDSVFEHCTSIDCNILNQETEGSFSDDDDNNISAVTKDTMDQGRSIIVENSNLKANSKNTIYCKNISFLMSDVIIEHEGLKTLLNSLHSEHDNETRCQVMERVVQIIIEDEIDIDTISALVSSLSSILGKQMHSNIFPANNITEESLMDSISTPLFVMFRNQFQLCKEEDKRKSRLNRILAEIQTFQPRIGYLLLYFLKVWCKEEIKREGKPSDLLCGTKVLVYQEFCSQREEQFQFCLLFDLERCIEDSSSLFCFLLPDIYTGFQNISLSNVQLLYMVVSTVDSAQLQDLISQIMQGHLQMLKKELVYTFITVSLNWDTFEQYCLWQIITAHDFSIDCILPVLSKLSFQKHAEALTSISFMLKQQKPTQELLKTLLSRQITKGDMFVVSLLKYWSRRYEDKFADILALLLSSRYPPNSPNKRKRSNIKNSQTLSVPSVEQVLGHLDQLRIHSLTSSELQFYHSENMQKSLQQAQNASSEMIKKNYGDLFSLAELNEDLSVLTPSTVKKHLLTSVSNSLRGSHKKVANLVRDKSTLKKVLQKDKSTESSDQTSEDEEISKPKQTKKRKKINLVGSDSD